MASNTWLLSAAALACFCGVASANIIYNVDFPPTPAEELVTGTITTDGATGPLMESDITAFDLTITGNLANFTLNSSVAGTQFSCSLFGGCGLTATTSTLGFDVALGFNPQAGFFDAAGNGITLSPSGGPNVELNFNVAHSSVLDWFTPSPMQLATSSAIGTVPEPGTIVLLGVALAGLGFSRRPKRFQ